MCAQNSVPARLTCGNSLRMITDKSYAKFVDDKLLCDIVKLAFIVVLDSIMKSHITEFKD